MENLKETLTAELRAALQRAASTEGWPDVAMPDVAWEYPPDSAFGDLPTPISFSLAKVLRRKPRDIAAAIRRGLAAAPGLVEKVEVAGAGYLNIFVTKDRWRAVIRNVLAAGRGYGRAGFGSGQRGQGEFVSATPTGPLHIGTGR